MALSFKQLCQLLDAKQPATVKRLLKARGVRWIPDRLGHPTTSDAEWDRAIARARRTLTFTAPPCRQKKNSSRSRPGSARSTAPGTSSSSTNGENYAE